MAPTGTLVNDAEAVAFGLQGDVAAFVSGPASAVIKFQAAPDGIAAGATWGDILGIPLDGLRAPESSRTLPAGGKAAYLFRLPSQLLNGIRAVAVGAQGGTTSIWWANVPVNSVQGVITPPAVTSLTQNVLTGSVKNTALTTVGNGTLLAAAVTGGLVTRSGPVAAFTDTLDTAANLIAALPALGQGQGVEFVVRNTTAFTLTLAAGTGVTLAGSTVLPANSAGRFHLSITGAATVTVTGEGVLFAAGGLPEASVSITTAGAGTLTAAGIVGGLITRSGPSAAYSDATDTAANVIAAMPNAAIGESWELTILNTVAFPQTITAGTGVTLAGNVVVAGNSAGRFLVTYTGAGAVTVNGLWCNTLDELPTTQFVAISAGNGTLAAGNMEGAQDCTLATSGATAMTTRTAAQIIAAVPNFRIGDSYRLRVYNTNAGTLTLTGGTGVTITGTATIATNVWRDYYVTMTGAATVTMQNIGAGNAT